MAVSVLSTEGDDGCPSETEARPPHHLHGALEQVSPPHLDVGLHISIHILLSEQSQDGVQVERQLHTTETGFLQVQRKTQRKCCSFCHLMMTGFFERLRFGQKALPPLWCWEHMAGSVFPADCLRWGISLCWPPDKTPSFQETTHTHIFR